MLIRSCLLCLCILGLSSCATEGDFKLPGVYRIDIQQGSIIDQDMVDKLKPGMDKNQVQFIMGTPPLADPFHANRWDYIYTYSKGGTRREQRHVTLYFKDNKLSHVTGDVVAGVHKAQDDLGPKSTTVEVPANARKEGFFHRLFHWGDDTPETGNDDSSDSGSHPQDTDGQEEPGDQD